MLRPRQGHTRFLIVGNGRTGSTWLLTSLDRLPNVSARHELKWLPDDSFVFDPEVHAAIEEGKSTSAVLDEVCRPGDSLTAIRGSKLIFNPWLFYGEKLFYNLSLAIERDIKTFLLKRRYAETWLSWKVRGVYHKVSPEAPADPSNRLMTAIRGFADPERIDLVLQRNGVAFSDAPGRRYELQDMIDDMLQFYVNDIQSLDLLNGRDGFVIDYDEIGSRFAELAQAIGADAKSPDIQAIVDNPYVLKLPSLAQHVAPIDLVCKFGAALDRAFLDYSHGHLARGDALGWVNPDTISIAAPSVVEALREMGVISEAGGLVWQVRRPVLAL